MLHGAEPNKSCVENDRKAGYLQKLEGLGPHAADPAWNHDNNKPGRAGVSELPLLPGGLPLRRREPEFDKISLSESAIFPVEKAGHSEHPADRTEDL